MTQECLFWTLTLFWRYFSSSPSASSWPPSGSDWLPSLRPSIATVVWTLTSVAWPGPTDSGSGGHMTVPTPFYFIFSHLAGILSWIPQHVFNTLQKSTTLSRTTAEKHKRHFFKRQFCQSFKISARTARQGSICHAIYCQCFYHYQGLSWRITISNSEFTIMKEKPYQNKCCEMLNTFNTLYSSVS